MGIYNDLEKNTDIYNKEHLKTAVDKEIITTGFFNNIFNKIDKFTDMFNKNENNVKEDIINNDNLNSIIINDEKNELDNDKNSETTRKNSMMEHSDTNRLSRYLDFFSNDCDNDLCKTNYLDEKGFLKTYKEYFNVWPRGFKGLGMIHKYRIDNRFMYFNISNPPIYW